MLITYSRLQKYGQDSNFWPEERGHLGRYPLDDPQMRPSASVSSLFSCPYIWPAHIIQDRWLGAPSVNSNDRWCTLLACSYCVMLILLLALWCGIHPGPFVVQMSVSTRRTNSSIAMQTQITKSRGRLDWPLRALPHLKVLVHGVDTITKSLTSSSVLMLWKGKCLHQMLKVIISLFLVFRIRLTLVQ